MEFEWDENKNHINIIKHKINFFDARKIFKGQTIVTCTDRMGEIRYVAIGEMDGYIIAVVYTNRLNRIRIISARRARREERRQYSSLFGRRTGQN